MNRESDDIELNIDNYEAADKLKVSWSFRLNLVWVPIKVLLIILILIIPVTLIGIFRLIVPNPKCIKGKLALVTGGGNGLGKAIAHELASKGANIVVVDIDIKAAQRTAEEIESKFKVKSKAFKVDVSKHSEIAQLKEDIESSLGFVDILINNAGLLSLDISLMEGQQDDVQKIIDVNLTSHLWVS